MTDGEKGKAKRWAVKAQEKSLSDRNADARIRVMKEFLQREVWPHIPAHLRGKKISKREQPSILGIASLKHKK
jgi:hypothetical protein